MSFSFPAAASRPFPKDTMQVHPYLFFDGRCEEALEFYQTALGAEVVHLLRFRESPEPTMIPPGAEDKVMHASFRIGDSIILASDGECQNRPAFQGFALSLMPPDDATGERLFAVLSEGGQVVMPMAQTFFASRFGMVTDRFGVMWLIVVASDPNKNS